MTHEVPATALADVDWLRADLDRAAGFYGRAGSRVLGTVRWYSASSVLVAASLEPLVQTGRPGDPALAAITIDMHDDGRYVDARSARMLDGDRTAFGTALGAALDPPVAAIAEVSGASATSLWAVAADSIVNRLLWAGSATGDVRRAMALAEELAEVIGPRMPRPRFDHVGERPVLRRASCCLIYEVPRGGQKCASCPRQTPAERATRLRAALGR